MDEVTDETRALVEAQDTQDPDDVTEPIDPATLGQEGE
jgi:hypothetical protein